MHKVKHFLKRILKYLKASKKVNFFIWIGGLVAFLALLAPIYFYVREFKHLPLSSSPSEWGPFGDFFGGILNPLISLLTLIVTVIIAIHIKNIEKRYHDEAVNSPVKPLFTIGTGKFYSSDISYIAPTIWSDYYSYKPPEMPAGSHDYQTKRFYLKIFNKGVGVANKVTLTFDINLTELKDLLTINHQNITASVTDIKTDEDGKKFIVVNYKSEYLNQNGSMKIWGSETYGLGVIAQGKKYKAPIPSQIESAFKLYNFMRRLDIPCDNFPIISVNLNYENIHGKKLSSKFHVGLVHVHDYLTSSIFRILQVPI